MTDTEKPIDPAVLLARLAGGKRIKRTEAQEAAEWACRLIEEAFWIVDKYVSEHRPKFQEPYKGLGKKEVMP